MFDFNTVEQKISRLQAEGQAPSMNQVSQLQTLLLDRVDQAILAVDLGGHIIYRNRATERLYGPADASVPSSWTQELDIITRVSKQKHWSGEMLVHCWDGTTFPALVIASPIHDPEHGMVGTVISVTDITPQKEAENRLERYVKRLENLHEIDRAILVAQSPESVALAAAKYIRQLIPCTRAGVTVFDLEAKEATILAVQTSGATQLGAGTRVKVGDFELPPELREGKVYLCNDIESILSDSPLLQVLRAEGVRAFVYVPLVAHGELIGSLNMTALDASTFSPERLEVAREVADQLAIALDNAQLLATVRQHAAELEQRVAERTVALSDANQQLQQEIHERVQAEAAEREQRALAEALRDTATTLNSTLNLDEVLDRILANVVRVVDHDVSTICLVESGTARMVRCRGYQEPGIEETLLAARWIVSDTPAFQRMVESGQPTVLTDEEIQTGTADFPELQARRSGVGAPIRFGGEIIGFINLGNDTPRFYTDIHADRLQIFADQAALAIQNARLFERSQALAVLEERQRLSHELHDSVSQTLWSASLIADVLPDLWEQDKDEGRHTLGRLRQLSRGALAEMRTLLLELHPTALTEVAFGELLQRLAEVTTSRTGIAVCPLIEGQVTLPAPVQMVLYRIAQEALGNVMRHAGATRITVHLRCESESLELRIQDNGRGFSPDRIRAGHLGVGIMRDRARSIGADLNIESEIGRGTEVTVVWPASEETTHHD